MNNMINAVNSAALQQAVFDWAQTKGFTAPYGILTGEHKSKSGRKVLSVTFGRARLLDATVEIYNRNFVLVRTSRHGLQSFKKLPDLKAFLETL
jgi:hypothetical protein